MDYISLVSGNQMFCSLGDASSVLELIFIRFSFGYQDPIVVVIRPFFND